MGSSALLINLEKGNLNIQRIGYVFFIIGGILISIGI